MKNHPQNRVLENRKVQTRGHLFPGVAKRTKTAIGLQTRFAWTLNVYVEMVFHAVVENVLRYCQVWSTVEDVEMLARSLWCASREGASVLWDRVFVMEFVWIQTAIRSTAVDVGLFAVQERSARTVAV